MISLPRVRNNKLPSLLGEGRGVLRKHPSATWWFGSLLLAYLVALPFFLSTAAFAAISPEEFLSSSAATAFKAGSFDEALKGFQTLLEKYPDDLTLLRYIGITYDRLERYDQAVATFRKGLSIAPNNPAIHYFLGITLFKKKEAEPATEAFERAIRLAPGTLYGKQAREYVQAINKQKSQDEPVGLPGRWDGLAQFGFQYDDNVLSAPNRGSGNRDSFRLVEYLAGGFEFPKDSPWRTRLGFATYQNQHTEGRFHNLNLSTLQPSLELGYITTVGAVPVYPTLRYDFNAGLLNGRNFNQSHSITARVDSALGERWILSPSYRFTVDEFREEGFDPRFSSRDAKSHSGGATLYYLFWNRRAHIRLGYEGTDNRADGSNFNSVSHKGIVGFTIPLVAEVNFDFGGEFSRDRYNDFHGLGGDRRTTQRVYAASLSRGFWNSLFVSLAYQHTLADSSYSALDYKRNIAGLTVAVKF
jgi:tetratricopeptide (TPR) repeat protein